MATRRGFLKSTASSMVGLTFASTWIFPQSPGGTGKTAADSIPESEMRIPKIPFGKTEVSRLIVGCNKLYGYAHYNQVLGNTMRGGIRRKKCWKFCGAAASWGSIPLIISIPAAALPTMSALWPKAVKCS